MPKHTNQPDYTIQDLQSIGIHYDYGAKIITDQNRMAMDSELVTAPNAGIPSVFTTFVDPKVIDVIVAPMKMAGIFGETKKGDWTSSQTMFQVVESTGETSTYGDFSESGVAGANVNYPTRQPYHFQTNIRVGEREMAIAGAGRLDLAARKQIAAQLTLNKFQNKSYILGVEGLDCRGMLNDKDLPATITVASWDAMDGGEVYESIRGTLYNQLNKQSGGILEFDSQMTLIISNNLAPNLTKTNQYNVNVLDQLKKNFPNLTIETVPEYSTNAGEMVQLILKDYEGQETVDLSFTEKMRTFPLVQKGSYWEQKRMAGTSGAIIYRPFLIVTALVMV